MNNTKFLLTLSSNGEITYHQQTTKQEILRRITPVLLPKSAIPKRAMRKNLPGLDDIDKKSDEKASAEKKSDKDAPRNVFSPDCLPTSSTL